MHLHPHLAEELTWRDGPVLWDADPDVCCAAFQLGACEHTEAVTDDDIAAALPLADQLDDVIDAPELAPTVATDEPF